jgi:diguanylate cyclase (GGDEF)-like protein
LLSYIDGLTGVANRRSFDASLEKEWRRCGRSELYLGLIIVDVDHFKLYNDHYGHLAGDECLKKVAGAIADQVNRPADLAARYGGEEFALLLPETDPDGLQIVADRLVSAVNALGIPHAGSMAARNITVSCGGTVSRPPRNCPVEDLLRYADALLYQAKQRGRNQAVVKMFPEPVAPRAL